MIEREREMKKKLKLFITMLFTVCSISSYSAFMVTQTSIGVNLSKPVTEDTTLINQGDRPVRVKVDFDKPKWVKDEYYLGDQLVAYPKIVIIPPKGSIQVKVAPRIKKDLEDGEYVALLMFKELPPRNNATQVTMLMNIGVPYYGRKGQLKAGMDFETLRVEKTEGGYELLGQVKNTGNFSYNLNIDLKFYKGNKQIKNMAFKQGFHRERVVEVKKIIPLDDTDVDYVEVVFENRKYDYSKKFRFEL